jgi:hypothetical protein
MNNALPEELLGEMKSYVRTQVYAGFAERDEIVEGTVEVFCDEADEADLLPHAERMVEAAFEAHALEQRYWQTPTDCDRLDAAFAALEATGIVCRQNFSCCGTCGVGEIWDEMEGHEPPARGYAFYHMQDTDGAVDSRGIYLHYGATQEGEAAALKVAYEITAVLSRHGLKVDWDGTWNKRIRVALDWKRRR